MIKKLKSLCIGTCMFAAVASVVGFIPYKPASTSITQIVAFGDSYSDNGNGAHKISLELLEQGVVGAYEKPGSLYWNNRYSNGYTAIEVAAQKLNVPLIDYAIGGAMSNEHNYSDWMDTNQNTGVLGQIETYKTSLAGQKAPEDTLYFILTGTNDYCKFTDYGVGASVEEVAKTTADSIETAVRSLAELGAKNIVVSEVNDVSIMPYEITENRVHFAKTFANTANPIIAKTMKQLKKEYGISIQVFELTKLTNKIVKHPEQYGFNEHVNVIQPTWPQVLPAATENLDAYMFFDEWHPSAALHKIIGEKLAESIQK